MKVTFSLSWKNILSLFASESLLFNVDLDLPILPPVRLPHSQLLLPRPLVLLPHPLPLPEYRERDPVDNLLLLLPLYLNLVRTHNSSGVC